MIMTVKGKIDKNIKGFALSHEHISCSDNNYVKAFGKKWLSREELSDYAANVLKIMKEEYNLSLFVDGTPIDLGRDVKLLSEVSEKSGVHIVASSGTYWFPGFVDGGNTEEELAKWFIEDCLSGMEETEVLPGILKCASGHLGITPEIEKRHKVMGLTQAATHLPIYVHCQHKDDAAFRQIELLTSVGADVEKIIIGHTAIRPDVEYLQTVLDKGCYISFDQCHCYPSKIAEFGESLAKLWERGYGDKILLANDYCIHSDFPAWKKNGLALSIEVQAERLAHVMTKVKEAFLNAGGSEENFNKMIDENIKNALDV